MIRGLCSGFHEEVPDQVRDGSFAQAVGLSAGVGYRIETARGTAIPFARLTGSRAARDGVAETNAIAVPSSHDAIEEQAVPLTLVAEARAGHEIRS